MPALRLQQLQRHVAKALFACTEAAAVVTVTEAAHASLAASSSELVWVWVRGVSVGVSVLLGVRVGWGVWV